MAFSSRSSSSGSSGLGFGFDIFQGLSRLGSPGYGCSDIVWGADWPWSQPQVPKNMVCFPQVLDCHWDCLLTLIEVHCFAWDLMSWFLMTQKSGERFLEFEFNIVARIGSSAFDLIQIDTTLSPRETIRPIAS